MGDVEGVKAFCATCVCGLMPVRKAVGAGSVTFPYTRVYSVLPFGKAPEKAFVRYESSNLGFLSLQSCEKYLSLLFK